MVHYLFQTALEETAELAETAAAEAAPVAAASGNLITQGLQITLVGMGILFVSLFILWGVMELLVRLVKDGPKEKEAEEASEIIETADEGDEMKLKAAAAAALALHVVHTETAAPAHRAVAEPL